MKRVLMLTVSAAVVTWAANAVADSPKLKGDYAFTGSATCIVDENGFNPVPAGPGSFSPNPGRVWLHSYTVEGGSNLQW
jgi:hypothetical protein